MLSQQQPKELGMLVVIPRKKNRKFMKSGKSKEIRNNGTKRTSLTSETINKRQGSNGKPREEASKRQANLLEGRHEELYRKAGYMV